MGTGYKKMQDFLNRISSYNLFNYLFPGVLFAVAAEKVSQWSFAHENTIITLFLCYFYGIVISRIGSLVIKPALKKIKLIEFKSYKDYIKASEKDKHIPILSEINNTYRTIISLIFCLAVLYGISRLSIRYEFTSTLTSAICAFLLIAVFIASYRKQTKFITKRIDAVLSKEKDEK